jgi:hypothetical protein
MFREYADEAIKQGKVFTEVAKETLEEVASETMKSKSNKQNELHVFIYSQAPKNLPLKP